MVSVPAARAVIGPLHDALPCPYVVPPGELELELELERGSGACCAYAVLRSIGVCQRRGAAA